MKGSKPDFTNQKMSSHIAMCPQSTLHDDMSEATGVVVKAMAAFLASKLVSAIFRQTYERVPIKEAIMLRATHMQPTPHFLFSPPVPRSVAQRLTTSVRGEGLPSCYYTLEFGNMFLDC